MTSVDEIEQLFKPLLLTTVKFTIDNKVIKQGKLQLFCVKDFFCVFTLINTEKSSKSLLFELPYPFKIKQIEAGLELDYTIDTFCLSNTKIKEQANKIKYNKPSKIFNKKIIVNSTY